MNKIIKELESNNSFAKDEEHMLHDYPYVKWGLGDDGELYYKAHMHGDHIDYGEFWFQPDFYISIKEMKKIIKEFGHLIVFI